MSDLIVIEDKVNISENNLRDKMSSIFNILLIDRTKSTKRCIKNIIWANENYIKYDAKKYYELVGTGDSELAGYYTYDATNVRLQELAVSYTFPAKWFKKKIDDDLIINDENTY